MSPAASADSPVGQGWSPSGTAELLCALSCGSALAVAEPMEHGTNTAFVGVQLGRGLGLEAADLEAIFYGALIKDVGCSACSAVIAPFFPDDQLVPALHMVVVDMDSPRSMLGWARGQLRLDAGLPSRLARLAAFATRWGPVTRELMTAHCEIAADFAESLGFGPHVQDAVRYQWERYDGRGQAFHRRAEAIPRPAQVLYLALAADIARGLAGADGAAALVRHRAGTHFDPDVAEAYLDLAGGLWPPGDDPVPLADVLACDPGTPVEALPGDRRLAVCQALADFADLKSARRGPTRAPSLAWPPRLAPSLAWVKPNRTGCTGPRWCTTWARSPCRTGCWRGQMTTRARRSARAGSLRSPSRSACILTTPSASWPGCAPSRIWPPTSAPTMSASTGPATRSGLAGRAYRSAPGCSPPPTPGPSGPATATPTSPMRTAWTPRAWPLSSPVPGQVLDTSAGAPVPFRPSRS